MGTSVSKAYLLKPLPPATLVLEPLILFYCYCWINMGEKAKEWGKNHGSVSKNKQHDQHHEQSFDRQAGSDFGFLIYCTPQRKFQTQHQGWDAGGGRYSDQVQRLNDQIFKLKVTNLIECFGITDRETVPKKHRKTVCPISPSTKFDQTLGLQILCSSAFTIDMLSFFKESPRSSSLYDYSYGWRGT